VGLSRGFAYVEYEEATDAEEAKNNMHGGQLDGNVITYG
jgi:RNA recognition motif-containing protein